MSVVPALLRALLPARELAHAQASSSRPCLPYCSRGVPEVARALRPWSGLGVGSPLASLLVGGPGCGGGAYGIQSRLPGLVGVPCRPDQTRTGPRCWPSVLSTSALPRVVPRGQTTVCLPAQRGSQELALSSPLARPQAFAGPGQSAPERDPLLGGGGHPFCPERQQVQAGSGLTQWGRERGRGSQGGGAPAPRGQPGREDRPALHLLAATNLCFAERNVYTSEVLAVVMQQLMEQSPLPMLLMRTVIQSLTMYPRLGGFVMNILSRLIMKQVTCP